MTVVVLVCNYMTRVLRHCWLESRKGNWPAKNTECRYTGICCHCHLFIISCHSKTEWYDILVPAC